MSYWKLGSTIGESIWEGIYKIPGATYCLYQPKGTPFVTVPSYYWKPEFQENTSDISDLVIDAIEKVKVSDVPVHIFLSGGIDSTIVASRFKGGNAIHLDSFERSYAEQVAKKYRIKLNVVNPDEIDIAECMRDYSLKCGEPSMAGVIPYITAREVAKHAKVAITANGADELFFGYNRTNDNVNIAQLKHMYRMDFDHWWSPSEIDSRLSAGRWLELQAYVQYDLNKTLDFASMAHTVEMRSPFLDHRLVEMALSIPQKNHGRKEILKNILRKEGFKEDFLNRPKHGFSLNVQPKNLDAIKAFCTNWCTKEGFLPMVPKVGRDKQYIEMSAIGFYYWYQTFKHIIE